MKPKSSLLPVDHLPEFHTLSDAARQGLGNRTYIMALVNCLNVRVDARLRRTLRLRLRNHYVWIQNTLQKRRIIEQWQNHDDLVDFLPRLAQPNSRGWLYRGPVPWRYGSAGYIPLFNVAGVRYLILFLRKYPFPRGWNLPLGGAQSCAELEQPHLLADREFKEETIAFNRRTNTLLLWERNGGLHNPLTSQRAVFEALRLPYPRRRKLVVGHLLPNQPDIIHVGGLAEPRRTPYISQQGIVIFNPADVGVEFLQGLEFFIDEPLSALRFFDGELHENCNLGDGIRPGWPILQPVGVFRFDDLVHEFSQRRPAPRPEMIFDEGWPVCGQEEIRTFMERVDGAREWCPAAVNGLRRFFDTIHDIRNQFTQLPDGRWLVRFRGEENRFPHWLAFAYLQYLLHQPRGTAVPSAQLYASYASQATWPGEPLAGVSLTELERQGVSLDSGGRAKSNRFAGIDAHLRRLADELSGAKSEHREAERANDFEDLARLEKKIQQLTDQLEQTAGDRARLGTSQASGTMPGSAAQRMTWAVSKEIRRGIGLIRASMPACGKHLDASISCGATCVYGPAVEVDWL